MKHAVLIHIFVGVNLLVFPTAFNFAMDLARKCHFDNRFNKCIENKWLKSHIF